MPSENQTELTKLLPLERRSALSLSSIFALRMLGLFLILPVFSVYARHLPGGEDTFMVGLTLGIYGLTQGILQVPFGVASDRWGRKPVIAFGLLIFALGSAVAAMGTRIEIVLLGRALQGAGAVSAAVTAMISDSVRERVLTRAMALVGASIGLTFAFSLIVSPILANFIGVAGLFWLTAVLSIAAIFVIIKIVPDTDTHRSNTPPLHAPWHKVVFDIDLLRLNIGIFFLHISQMALFVVIPLQLNTLGLSVTSHWYVYLPSVLISFGFMMPAIMRAERAGRMRELFLSAILLILLVHVAFIWLDTNLYAIGLLLVVFFTGFNILEASLPSLVSRTAPPADKGLALGVYNTTQSIGLFVGGAAGGWLFSHYGANGVYCFSIMLMGLWLIASWSMKTPAKHQRGQEIDLR